MTFEELKKNVANLFPQDKGESLDRYQWWLKQALEPFRNRAECSSAWEGIAQYDGNSNRPKLNFFFGVASGSKDPGKTDFMYYQCSCGQKLSASSNGGCPVCKRQDAEFRLSADGVRVLEVQAWCFDCSVYTESVHVYGPSCTDFGTPAFNDCKLRGQCRCANCCRFEYMRTYHPHVLREDFERTSKMLPPPTSESGMAFHDRRADVKDINKYLKHVAEKKSMDEAERLRKEAERKAMGESRKKSASHQI